MIFISMGVVAHSPPNFVSAQRAFGTPPGPVKTHAFEPIPLFDKVGLIVSSFMLKHFDVVTQVNGIMNMVRPFQHVCFFFSIQNFNGLSQVFAYGGAMIFPEMVSQFIVQL